MVADLSSALAALRASGAGERLGITGFCFGDGLVWSMLATGAPLKAAVPYYGPAPANPAAIATTRAAVFAVYAEQDTRITGTALAMEALLKQSASPHQVTVYPGVNHAFHDDTGSRYNAEQAERAWVATVEWFRKYI